MRVAPLVLAVAILAGACGSEGPDSRQASNEKSLGVDQAGNSEGKLGDAFVTGSAAGGVAAPAMPPALMAEQASARAVSPARSGSEQLPAPAQSAAPSMVIRTGDARIEVDSVEIAVARLHQLAQRLGGYIGNTSMQAGERELRQATVELKIPADRFDAAQAGLSTLGKVEYVNVNAADVGEEFVDVTARVDNARRLEQRLIALLASRTGKLEEVLSVERELARVREMIERYEGRLRYLRSRVSVSTISVTVHEKQPLVGELGSDNRIVEAFKQAWRNFVGFLAAVIESLGVLIPLGLIAALIARWAWRRRPPPPPPTTPPAVA